MERRTMKYLVRFEVQVEVESNAIGEYLRVYDDAMERIEQEGFIVAIVKPIGLKEIEQ